MGGRGGLLSGLFGGSARGGFGGGGAQPGGPSFGGQPPQGGFQRQGPGANRGGFPAGGPGGFQQTPSGGFTAASAAGMSEIGRAGALRLFTAPLAKEASWLLPFALFGAVLLGFGARPRWPVAPKHRALLIWGGWLLTAGIFFSVAGFFHQYYLTMMAPPIAALVGIGAVETWGIWNRNRWIGSALLLAAAGGTIALQISNARVYVPGVWWTPVVIAVLVAGALSLAVAFRANRNRFALAGFALVVAAMIVTPGIWSGLTSADAGTSSNLPAAYGGQEFGRGGGPGPGFDGRGQSSQALIDYLQANTRGTKYLVAVASANQGASYVLETGRPVLYMGGFSGQDKVVTSADLSRLAADGELKYILWGGGGPGGGFGGQSDISSWITANATPVQGYSTSGGFGMGGTLYQINSTVGS